MFRETHNPPPNADDPTPLFTTDEFSRCALDSAHVLWVGRIPQSLMLNGEQFRSLWELHPAEYNEIKIHGRSVKTPRWQQAYAVDYRYTGQVNKGLPTPSVLEPFLRWGQETIDPRLNGMLVNWYDGRLGHYIGRHRDRREALVPGSPIVTISFGEERTFRLRPYGSPGCRDFAARHGSVFVMPYETNLAWTHEVPRRKQLEGRRISITIRAFRIEI